MDEKKDSQESQGDELCRLEETYKYETYEELKRKREVYRSHIVGETQDKIEKGRKDLAFNRKAYESLSEIIRKRERASQRREFLKELMLWAGLFGPLILGVIIGLSSHTLKEFIENIARLIIHPE